MTKVKCVDNPELVSVVSTFDNYLIVVASTYCHLVPAGFFREFHLYSSTVGSATSMTAEHGKTGDKVIDLLLGGQ